MTDVDAEQRGIGMAFQNFALFPHMTAFDNIASAAGGAAAVAPRSSRQGRKVAKLLKIGHVLSHTPRELSNGQKQRTALARALVGSPQILLLDDPLRNVDAKLRFEMRLELPRLLDGLGLDGPLRHPGLQGGDGARRPHRRAARRPLRAGRHARARSIASRRRSGSPGCSATRRSTCSRSSRRAMRSGMLVGLGERARCHLAGAFDQAVGRDACSACGPRRCRFSSADARRDPGRRSWR